MIDVTSNLNVISPRQLDSFVTKAVHRAMDMDGYVSSHPVYVPVATPAQITEVFDSISYYKVRFVFGIPILQDQHLSLSFILELSGIKVSV